MWGVIHQALARNYNPATQAPACCKSSEEDVNMLLSNKQKHREGIFKYLCDC